jgi:hypothetical protein
VAATSAGGRRSAPASARIATERRRAPEMRHRAPFALPPVALEPHERRRSNGGGELVGRWPEWGRRRPEAEHSSGEVRGGVRVRVSARLLARSNQRATVRRTGHAAGPNDDDAGRTMRSGGGQSTVPRRTIYGELGDERRSIGKGGGPHSECCRSRVLEGEAEQSGRWRSPAGIRRRGRRVCGAGEPPESIRRRRPTQSTETNTPVTLVTRAEGRGHAYSTAAPMAALGRVGESEEDGENGEGRSQGGQRRRSYPPRADEAVVEQRRGGAGARARACAVCSTAARRSSAG